MLKTGSPGRENARRIHPRRFFVANVFFVITPSLTTKNCPVPFWEQGNSGL